MNYQIKNTSKKSPRKLLIIIVATSLILICSVYYFLAMKNDKSTFIPSDSDNTEIINLTPPTDEEQAAGDDLKQNIPAAGQPESDEDSANNTASVIITDAGQYDDVIEVRAFIPNHLQDGTCSITFTKGSQSLTRETPAYADASTTICANPLIKRSEFPSAGDWQVSVGYTAPGASGQSEKQTITIN